MPNCHFCNSELSTNSSLNKHIKTSKYCIKSRDSLSEVKLFECKNCKKEFTSKHRMNLHTCKTTQTELQHLKDKVETLTKEIVQLKDKPTTITVNTDNSMTFNNYTSLLDCSTEKITETFRKHYNTIEQLLQSDQKHLADVTVQHLLSGKDQPMYFVTDRSRNKFMYTDKENNAKEDANATILRSMVYRGIKPIIKNLYHEEFKRLRKELAIYQRKDSDECILSRHKDLKELEEAYQQMDIIKENDDYIAQLSKCLPSSIIDRIYKDNILKEEYDSDEEFKRQLEHEVRMIGEYSVLELQKFKVFYKETGKVNGPQSIVNNKEFISFLEN